METVEIRSNVIGDILKIRNGVVYKNYETVVDELFQNAQRANATEVSVEITADVFSMIDNGIGCDDPQSLLEKNTSAWLNEDEAFGEGFFSVFLLADMVFVRSHDWELVINVNKMIETKNLNVEVVQDLDFMPGMKVTIIGEKVSSNSFALKSEVRLIASTMDFNVTLNGKIIEKENYFVPRGEYEYLVDSRMMTGVMKPQSGYSVVSWFYENRPVRKEYFEGITGRINIKKKAVTLKAPDRKDFIYDKKYTAMLSEKDNMARSVFLRFIEEARSEDINDMAEAINRYLSVEDYQDCLKVSSSLMKTVSLVSSDDITPTKKDMKSINSTNMATTTVVENKELVEDNSSMSLCDLIKNNKKLVFVIAKETQNYIDKIKKAEYYGYSIIYSPNILYTNVLREKGVLCIDELEDTIHTGFRIVNDEPRNKKEKCFLSLMNRIERHYLLNNNTIRLADLSGYEQDKRTSEILTDNLVVSGLTDLKENMVYIDRDLIDFSSYRISSSNSERVTIHDMRILLQVWRTLVHELAHLVYKTRDNTIEHMTAEQSIANELSSLF